MSTQTTPDTDILAGLDFSPTLPCESMGHNRGEFFWHEGARYAGHAGQHAEWQHTYVCDHCAYTHEQLVCDAFKNIPLETACDQCFENVKKETFTRI